MLQLLVDRPTRQLGGNRCSNTYRERQFDSSAATNITTLSHGAAQENDELLPLATPMPSVTTNKR